MQIIRSIYYNSWTWSKGISGGINLFAMVRHLLWESPLLNHHLGCTLPRIVCVYIYIYMLISCLKTTPCNLKSEVAQICRATNLCRGAHRLCIHSYKYYIHVSYQNHIAFIRPTPSHMAIESSVRDPLRESIPRYNDVTWDVSPSDYQGKMTIKSAILEAWSWWFLHGNLRGPPLPMPRSPPNK